MFESRRYRRSLIGRVDARWSARSERAFSVKWLRYTQTKNDIWFTTSDTSDIYRLRACDGKIVTDTSTLFRSYLRKAVLTAIEASEVLSSSWRVHVSTLLISFKGHCCGYRPNEVSSLHRHICRLVLIQIFGHSIAFNIFSTLWPCDLDLWPNINWWARYREDYPCAKFGDFTFTRFVLSCGYTDTQNHTYTDAAKRFIPASVVGVSNQSSQLQC